MEASPDDLRGRITPVAVYQIAYWTNFQLNREHIQRSCSLDTQNIIYRLSTLLQAVQPGLRFRPAVFTIEHPFSSAAPRSAYDCRQTKEAVPDP